MLEGTGSETVRSLLRCRSRPQSWGVVGAAHGRCVKLRGHAEGPGQPKVQAANKVAHKPTAGPGDTDGKPQAHGGHFNDGKNNKVGNLPHGDAFGTLKVQPKNKEVKAG